MNRLVKEAFKFSVVGTIGFVVDSVVLYSLKEIVGLYHGRLISFMIAVVVTWALNRTFTFDVSRSITKRLWIEFFHYLSLMSIGGVINVAVYSSTVMSNAYVEKNPIIGVAIGSIAGMLFNFISSKIFIYRKSGN